MKEADSLELDLGGINLLARERPDILAVICRDRFLPPTQLIYALKALEWYPDKDGLSLLLGSFLKYPSKRVREQARITLGIDDGNETA